MKYESGHLTLHSVYDLAKAKTAVECGLYVLHEGVGEPIIEIVFSKPYCYLVNTLVYDQ